MSDPMSNRLAQPDFWNRQLAERMAEMAEIRAAGDAVPARDEEARQLCVPLF